MPIKSLNMVEQKRKKRITGLTFPEVGGQRAASSINLKTLREHKNEEMLIDDYNIYVNPAQ